MYVVLHPHSITNVSNKFRVVDSDDWVLYANGIKSTLAFVGTFDSYEEADSFKTTLNERNRNE